MPPSSLPWRQVRDAKGHWYDAKVVDERGEGQERELRIHWHGWNAKYDEWIQATSDRILDEDEELPEEVHDWGSKRGHLGDDQWEVARLLKRQRREGSLGYVVEWAEIKEDGEAWAPSWVALQDICPQLIEEFENPPAELAQPYVESIEEVTIPPEIADVLVVEWRDDIGRQAAKLLARQRDEFACRRLFQISPCPTWLFTALRRALVSLANDDSYVTEIRAVRGSRGGKFIEDQFDVVSTDLVSKLVGEFNAAGHGALALRENNTAVMLVPPLEFKFRTRRQEGTEKWPTELLVTGHCMCLVDRKGAKGPRWAFDDDRAEYGPENKHAYKLAVADAMRALGRDVVPTRLLDFLSLL
jgi:hypothetical protein